MKFLVAYAVALLVSVPAGAVELHHMDVRKGTQGLERVPVSVTDSSASALSCHAQLAHWYSAMPMTVAPGATATMDLWYDPATGTYSILNVKRENMTVETLWCGFAGRAYETRAQIPLDRSTSAPGARSVTCDGRKGRLRCR